MERPEMRKKRSCSDPLLKKKRKEQAIGGKRQRRHKPEDDEVVLLDAGSSKEEERRRRKHEEEEKKKSRRPKHGGKKVVRWRLRHKLLDFIRTREALGHFATRTPPIRSKMTKLLFDPQLRREVAAEFEENKEFDSYVLYQYRTKGYFEIRELVDDTDSGDDGELRYFVSDYESE